jgi:hypothetical protein
MISPALGGCEQGFLQTFPAVCLDLPVHEHLLELAAFIGSALVGFEGLSRSGHFLGLRGLA